jgi:hypothetical protein
MDDISWWSCCLLINNQGDIVWVSPASRVPGPDLANWKLMAVGPDPAYTFDINGTDERRTLIFISQRTHE